MAKLKAIRASDANIEAVELSISKQPGVLAAVVVHEDVGRAGGFDQRRLHRRIADVAGNGRNRRAGSGLVAVHGPLLPDPSLTRPGA